MPRPELSTLRYPNLWQGCVGAWCPSQSGATGYRLFDDSGNNNHGVLTNMDPGTDWVQSNNKLALNFNGNKYVPTGLLCSNRQALDISAWIYRASTSNNAYVGAGEGGGTGPRANIYIAGSTTYVTAESSGGSAYGGVSNTRIGWNHFHYSYVYIGSNADNLKLWINGVEQSLTYSGFTPASLGNVGFFEIGRTKGENGYSTAIIDDVRAWSRRLTPSEILQLASSRGVAYEKYRRKKAYVPGYRITAPSRIQTGSARTIDGTDTESLSRGLVGAWCPSLGASGFRLVDRSGNNNHGTLTNMDPGTDWIPSGGKLALDFDGVDDYVSIPNAASLQITGPITISFLANITNNSGISTLISKSAGTDGEYEIFADFRSGATTLAWRPGIGTNLTTFFNGFTGVWTHYCFTCDGASSSSTVTCYRNGVSAGTITTNVLRATSTYALTIGQRPTAVNPANTKLDDIRIYNRALTPSEIRLLYTGGRGVGLMPEVKPKRSRIVSFSSGLISYLRRRTYNSILGSGVLS